MDIQFGNAGAFACLGWVALVAIVMVFALVARRKARRQFATSNLIHTLLPPRKARRHEWKNLFGLLALLALVLGLADIRWGKVWREVPQRGIEVVFALDVSRSMLAEDVTPNRLGRAKQQIKDMVDEMSGDRVGLVLFAGEARQEIPLTSHYHDFAQGLDRAGPHDLRRGGTNLGAAIQVATDSFLARTSDHKAVVLFTDGEDHQSDPVEVARRAFEENGIRVFTIGLGDTGKGARVPGNPDAREGEYLQYAGEPVWSRLDGKTLQEMALVSQGAYVPAGTKQVDMAKVYRNYVSKVEQQDFETARIRSYIPRFPWFFGCALVFLMVETLLDFLPLRNRTLPASGPSNASDVEVASSGRGQFVGHSSAPGRDSLTTAALALFGLITLLVAPTDAQVADVYALAEQAKQSMESGDYQAAVKQYQQASQTAPDRDELQYNQAVACYRLGDLAAARELFSITSNASDPEMQSSSLFNLGNCDYSDALQLAKEDPDTAKARAKSAISHFRSALAVNPSDTDARANIELASRFLRQLAEEEKQQQKNQESQQQNQESQQQEQDGQQQEQDGQQQNQDSQQQNQDGQQKEQDGQQQNQDGQQQEQEPAPSQGGASDGSSGSGDSNPSERTSKASQSGQSSPSEQESSADPSSGQAQADAGLDRQGIDDAHPDREVMRAEQPMTRQEALKLLQSVRDRDLLRRLQNERKIRRQYIPGEKDW